MVVFQELFYIFIDNSLLFVDIWVQYIYIFNVWFLFGTCFSFMLLVFGVSWAFIFLELIFVLVCFLIGQKYIEFYLPSVFIRGVDHYLNIISDYFGPTYGSKSEDFLPPFEFGYRKYFFSRIVGWKGTWASYLKRHRRRIRSSVAEWGYKNRIPTWYYYVMRGGRRIQITMPSNFRRISNPSYTSPLWFYSFPVDRQWIGHRDDEWDEHNWHIFLDTGYRRIHMLHTDLLSRPKYYRFYLSSWVEKWAPSLSPSLAKLEYSQSVGTGSPYSYFNFPMSFFESSKVATHRQPTHLGFETGIKYSGVSVLDPIHPRLLRPLRRYVGSKHDLAGHHNVKRTITSIGDNYVIDVKAEKIRYFKVKLSFYDIIQAKNYKGDYDYFRFIRLYWYHTFVEFFSLVFESLYIYPFEIKFTNQLVRLDGGFPIDYFFGWDLNIFVEFLLTSGLIGLYAFFFVAYFFICVMVAQVFKFFSFQNIKLNFFLVFFLKYGKIAKKHLLLD